MIIWVLVGYMWLMVHRIFEVWPAYAAFRPILMCLICLVLLWLFGAKEKRALGNIFTLALFFYTFALFLSATLSPFTDFFNHDFQNWLKEIIFFVILMTCVKTERDLKIIVTGFTVSVFLYMAHSYRGYLNGNVIYEAGANRLIGLNTLYGDPNDYGTFLIFSLPLIFPLITLCKKHWHYLFVLGYFLLTLRSALGTGSRTAFLMMLVLTTLLILVSRHRFKLIPLVLTVAAVSWFVLPEQMQNRYRTIWDDSISEQANINMEGRFAGFYGGLRNWENYPLSGAGPAMHGVALDIPFQSHNLYGQLAGETGTVGMLAFAAMLLCIAINHFNIWRHYKFLQKKNLGSEGIYCWRVSLAIMCAILMVLLQGIGLHNAYRFPWIWFGAFQALAALIMLDKVDAAIKGTLLPSLPAKKLRDVRLLP